MEESWHRVNVLKLNVQNTCLLKSPNLKLFIILRKTENDLQYDYAVILF